MSKEVRLSTSDTMNSVVVPISGMTCAACVNHVTSALGKLPNVCDVSVNLASEKAILKSNLQLPDLALIESTLTNAGYGIQTTSFTVGIEGMTCTACVSHIENAIMKISGVKEVSVNLAAETAKTTFIAGQSTTIQIRKAIENAGYTPVNFSADSYEFTTTEKQAKTVMFKSLVSITIGFLMMFIMYAENLFNLEIHWKEYLFFVLAIPVQIWAAKEFYSSAWNALKHGTSNMNTLISLGTTVAFSYSTLILILNIRGKEIGTGTTYFDAACFITGLVLLGRYLESRARRRAANSIQSLLSLNPQEAIIKNGTHEITIPVDDVPVGAEIIVKPGAKIPVDGIVNTGTTEVNESMLTGESEPQMKTPGSKVFAATINGNGLITYESKAIGTNTVYSKIMQLVEEAQSSKAPIQKFADKVASRFVPTVLLIAIITLISWFIFGPDPSYKYAIPAAVAVLVIACPCAMGLATPTAVMVGTGRAAESGILFKDAETLEITKKISTIVFDKTGTLTDGNLSVSSVEPEEGYSENDVLSFAASIESGSEHFIAKSILQKARSNQLTFDIADQFSITPGRGASGIVNGEKVIVGNAHFLNEHHITIDKRQAQFNSTVVYVASEGSLIGKILLNDNIRSEASEAISNLKLMGIKVLLLSGDQNSRARYVANKIGITEVISEVTPNLKANTIKSLQEKGEFVCMVGDGINDAPALAQSNLGIAMASGTDIANETASITLIKNNLTAIIDAIETSKLSIRTIKQNLLWAFGYNIILIPIAAGILYPLFTSSGVPTPLSPVLGIQGLLNPAIAALAMALSSISVVLNSLRLKTTLLNNKQ